MENKNKHEANLRFVVDERLGCIAIRDTQHPSFNKSNGLHEYTPDVFEFEMGDFVFKNGTPAWILSSSVVARFNEKCKTLNASIN